MKLFFPNNSVSKRSFKLLSRVIFVDSPLLPLTAKFTPLYQLMASAHFLRTGNTNSKHMRHAVQYTLHISLDNSKNTGRVMLNENAINKRFVIATLIAVLRRNRSISAVTAPKQQQAEHSHVT